MSPTLYALASVAVVSLLSLIGATTLAFGRSFLQRALLPLVSLAVGGLLGGAIIHLIPHALHEMQSERLVALLACGGFVAFFLLDRAIGAARRLHGTTGSVKTFVLTILAGGAVHNFLDGMVIAAAYLAGTPVGVAVTIAVILHEIPHELGSFGVLVHGGLGVRRALLFNFLSGVTAVLGATLVLVAGAWIGPATAALLPLAAGAFLYVAAAQLIPELKTEPVRLRASLLHAALIGVGVSMVAAALLLKAGTE